MLGMLRRIWVPLALTVCWIGCASQESAPAPSEVMLQHNVRGTAYLGQLKWTEAAQAFAAALEIEPGNPTLLTNRAVAIIQQGEIEAAEKLLLQALELDPQHPHAHYNLGLIEKNRGNFAPATAHFEAVREQDPADLLTQYNLGIVYSRTDRGDEAEAAFREALKRDPTHVSSLYGLGRYLLQRGDTDEGARLVNLSQEIRSRSGLDAAVGTEYGEQGPYALGINFPGDRLAAPDPIELSFTKSHAVELAGEATGAAVWSTTRLEPGGAVGVILAHAGELRRFDASGVRSLGKIDITTDDWLALSAGDWDNDAVVDLAALTTTAQHGLTLVQLRQDAEGKFSLAGELSLSTEAATAGDLVFVDADHDGDLDLFSCWTSGCALAVNDGSGTFSLVAPETHGIELPQATAPIRVALSDFDNDRDIDLLVFEGGGAHLFVNQRDGSFADVTKSGLWDEPTAGLRASAIADMNKDGWMDLVAQTSVGTELLINRTCAVAEKQAIATGPSDGLLVFDHDNDGFLDIVRSAAQGAVLLRNEGGGKFAETTLLGEMGSAQPHAAIDIDGDGDLDLFAGDDREFGVWLNQGGNANQWITVDSRGLNDNRFGIGAKIELLSGALRQKFEITDPLPLHTGLGDRTTVQSVRYLWPSGVLQDELDQPAGAIRELTQVDRKGTSCPLLYAWRDGSWRFVTDFLGGAAIGYQQAPGVFNTPDTDEYVRVEGGLSVDADGLLRLRMNNQLEEVLWFDQVELLAIDHPQGTELFPNERLMPGPPWPEFKLFVSGSVRALKSARGIEDGAELSGKLAETDRDFVDNFANLPYKGYAEQHTIELDLGSFDNGSAVVLLLDGWIDYADSTANIAAVQAGEKLMPPLLSVADGNGGWTATEHLMGFPAGLPKTMSVELSGLFPSPDHRIRIATNMRIYWDRARVMLGQTDDAKIQRLPVMSAELRYGGFPAESSLDGAKPFGYDPETTLPAASWKAHVGAYTAFGHVTDLLSALDDRFVTTRNGDEVELRFAAPQEPAEGFTRTYLFYADGFGKDMDPNSAANNEVGPIPFHGMPTYPYGEEVRRPVMQADEDRPSRRVLPSPSGWPGARPQPLVAAGG